MNRIFVGGIWNHHPRIARVAYRFSYAPFSRSNTLGLRLARPDSMAGGLSISQGVNDEQIDTD